MKFAVALIVALWSSAALGSELTAKDVRTLLMMVGLNPGTIKQLGDKGLHQLLRVRVSGKRGKFIILVREREVK